MRAGSSIDGSEPRCASLMEDESGASRDEWMYELEKRNTPLSPPSESHITVDSRQRTCAPRLDTRLDTMTYKSQLTHHTGLASCANLFPNLARTSDASNLTPEQHSATSSLPTTLSHLYPDAGSVKSGRSGKSAKKETTSKTCETALSTASKEAVDNTLSTTAVAATIETERENSVQNISISAGGDEEDDDEAGDEEDARNACSAAGDGGNGLPQAGELCSDAFDSETQDARRERKIRERKAVVALALLFAAVMAALVIFVSFQ